MRSSQRARFLLGAGARNRLGRSLAANISAVGSAIVRKTSFAVSPYCIARSGQRSIHRSTASLNAIRPSRISQGAHRVMGLRKTNATNNQPRVPTSRCKASLLTTDACSMNILASYHDLMPPVATYQS